jgi:hypothetical protein
MPHGVYRHSRVLPDTPNIGIQDAFQSKIMYR